MRKAARSILLTNSNANPRQTPDEFRSHLLITDQAHPERLVHFLNALLRLDGPDAIVTATLRGTEQEVVLGFERKVVFDVHCTTQADEPVIVELEPVGQNAFKDRMLYYYVELPKFNLTESQLKTQEDMWLYALKTMAEAKFKPKKPKGPIFEDLFTTATISKFDSRTMEALMSNLLDEAARNDELSYACDTGKQQGVAQGEAIGLEMGQRNFDLAQIETIKAMLSKGCDWAFIEDITHLNEAGYLTLKAKYPPT